MDRSTSPLRQPKSPTITARPLLFAFRWEEAISLQTEFGMKSSRSTFPRWPSRMLGASYRRWACGPRCKTRARRVRGRRVRLALARSRLHPNLILQESTQTPSSGRKSALFFAFLSLLLFSFSFDPLVHRAMDSMLICCPTLPARDLILVVDDNADMRHYLSSILSQYCQVQEARDGRHARQSGLPSFLSLSSSPPVPPSPDAAADLYPASYESVDLMKKRQPNLIISDVRSSLPCLLYAPNLVELTVLHLDPLGDDAEPRWPRNAGRNPYQVSLARSVERVALS
jgi:CheY-like chemotaxis protein